MGPLDEAEAEAEEQEPATLAEHISLDPVAANERFAQNRALHERYGWPLDDDEEEEAADARQLDEDNEAALAEESDWSASAAERMGMVSE